MEFIDDDTEVVGVEFENEMEVPIPCPDCGGKLIVTWKDAMIGILKERHWYCCKNVNCNYCEEVEVVKSRLYCI